MLITHVKLENWRNFHHVDAVLHARTFLIGPNGSGKSNFLDVFRFLRDVAASGLQRAVQARAGLAALRWLGAAPDAGIAIELAVDDGRHAWCYRLVINQDDGARPMVIEELVTRNGVQLESRPNGEDLGDPERLFATSLEQVAANREFRVLSEFFRSIAYQHLIPHLVRDPAGFGSGAVSDDPFGRDLLLRLWRTPERTRKLRLASIGRALQAIVPQLSTLELVLDQDGMPHLMAAADYGDHEATVHDERSLSDGTLRLIGLLWSLLDGDGPLLLEEPEMSLHSRVVDQLVQTIGRINQSRRIVRQVLISTHSQELLSDKGIAADEVLRLVPGRDGTAVLQSDAHERAMVAHGLSVADAMLPKSAPAGGQLALAF